MVIAKDDCAKVLAALYNRAQAQGLGVFGARSGAMTETEAAAILKGAGPRPYFDYLKGRVMKVAIPVDGGEIDTRLYDRDNGSGAGGQAILDALTAPTARAAAK